MAKKSKSSGTSSFWIQVWLLAGIVLVLGLATGLGFFGKVNVPKSEVDKKSGKPKEVVDEETGMVVEPTPQAPRKTLKELETQIKNLHESLMSISGRGETGAFAKIRAMAEQAKMVLDASRAKGVTPAERRRILEEGLAAKGDWLSSLHESTAEIHSQQEKDNIENPPISTEGVVTLTTESFSNFIAENHHTMVEFYAPWCGHCKKFAPEYKKAADLFQGRAAFGVVDGTAESTLTRVYDIKHYPTLKWFVQGRAFDVGPMPNAEKVTEFVEARLQPAYMDVDLKSDLEEALNQGGHKSVWLFGGEGEKNNMAFKSFLSAAEHFRGKLVFGYAPAGESSFTLYKGSVDDTESPSEADLASADKLIEWLQARYKPEADDTV